MAESLPYKNLLLDLDGTLVQYPPIRVQLVFIWNVVRKVKRYSGVRKAVRALAALAAQTYSRGSEGESNHERAARELARIYGVDSERAFKELDLVLNEVFPALKPYFSPIPGAAEFVSWAQSRYNLVLATNPVWPESVIRMRLSWSGVDPSVFRSFTHYDRMAACKPWPEYYSRILKEEQFDASETLMIGNETKTDLPATAAGISAFILSDEARAKPIVGQGAPAWTGNFEALQKFLDGNKVG